jgi:hypothetical protein
MECITSPAAHAGILAAKRVTTRRLTTPSTVISFGRSAVTANRLGEYRQAEVYEH